LNDRIATEPASIDWDRAARHYNRQAWLERAPLDAAIDLAEIGSGERLLDVATGTAALLRRLARRPSAPASVIGVDRSAAMLAQAPELPPGWRLMRADAARLPFSDSEFDVITAAYLLHFLDREERRAVLAEVRRVLDPRGRVVIVTVDAPRGGALGRALEPIQAAARRSIGMLAGLRALDPRLDLEEAGFTVARSRHLGRGYPSLVTVATVTDVNRFDG